MKSLTLIAAPAALLLGVQSAQACVVYVPPRLEKTLEADAVVIGHVMAFEPGGTSKPPFLSRVIRGWSGTGDDADRAFKPARVTLRVEERLLGAPPAIITADWDVETNSRPPDRLRGAYLMALDEQDSSASPGAGAYAVMIPSCSTPFVFRRGGASANVVRALFGLPAEPLEPPPRSLIDRLGLRPVPWPALVASMGFWG